MLCRKIILRPLRHIPLIRHNFAKKTIDFGPTVFHIVYSGISYDLQTSVIFLPSFRIAVRAILLSVFVYICMTSAKIKTFFLPFN